MPEPDFKGRLRRNEQARQQLFAANENRHKAILARQTPRRPRPRTGSRGGSQQSDAGKSTLTAVVVLVLVVFLGNATGIIKHDDSKGSSSSSAPKAGNDGTSDGQKLLAEAVKFDNKAYVWGGGHPPTEAIVSKGVDCSGLVSVSVLRAFGINDDHLAEGFRRSKYWKPIDMKDARPGDIVYRLIATHGGDTDHVAFVAKNNGPNDLRTFEAYGSNGIPYDEQVGYKNRKYKSFTGALRFKR